MDFPDLYGWVLFVELLIAFMCLLVGFTVVGLARAKIFNKEYLTQNYVQEFQSHLGRAPDREGYPDMGNGRISSNLPFSDWYKFNNAQRTHYNFLEQVYLPLVCIPIAGLNFDIATIVLGSVYILGRIIVTISYSKFGPTRRLIGVSICYLCLLGLLGVSVASCYYVSYG